MSLLKRKIGISISFLILGLGVYSQRGINAKPWNGIYKSFPTFWIGLCISIILMVIIVQSDQTSWAVVITYCLVLSTSIVSHSLLWAPPWGFRDPWRHIGDILDKRLSIGHNIYPSFHSLSIIINKITDISPRVIVSGGVILVAIVGVLFASIVVRKSSINKQSGQLALIASIPSLFLNFTPRPFALGYPFLLIVIWLVCFGTLRKKILTSVFGFALIFIHPFILFIMIIFLFSEILVNKAKLKIFEDSSKISMEVGTLALGIGIFYILFVTSGFADGLIIALANTIFKISNTNGGGGPSGAGLIAKAFSSKGNFLEFISRSSFLLALSVTALIAIFKQFKEKKLQKPALVSTISGVVVLSIFLVISFVPKGVGITRLFILGPVFFVPIIPKSLKANNNLEKIFTAFLALLIIFTGIFTAFSWPATGGIDYAATKPQVEGVNWAVENTDGVIVGSDMTHWIITGLYGQKISTKHSRFDGNGMFATKVRSARYSWSAKSEGLVVVDGAEIARAKFNKRESSGTGISCWGLFKSNQNMVYDNGDTKHFIRNHPPKCPN